MDRAKPYAIPKREVWEAYKRVRANQGAAGIDGQTIADFEADLIPSLIDQNPCAHFLSPMDMILQG